MELQEFRFNRRSFMGRLAEGPGEKASQGRLARKVVRDPAIWLIGELTNRLHVPDNNC